MILRFKYSNRVKVCVINKFLFSVFIIFFISFLSTSARDTIIVNGSTTVGPIAESFAKYFEAVNTNVIFKVEASGSGFGAKALIEKKCDIALMSRFMKEKEFKMAVENGVMPVFHFVVRDGIALVVNERNPINNLNLEQIRNIYNGKIRNWKELGWIDKEIIVIARCTTSGTREVFDEFVAKNEDSLRCHFEVVGNKEIEDLVRKYDNAIGYVGLGFLEGVKVLSVNGIKPDFNTINDGVYPLTRPLFMVTNGYPRKDSPVYDFISFSRRPEGIDLIKQLGWFGPSRVPLSILLKEIFYDYWQLAVALIIVLLSLIAFSIYSSRLNVALRQVVSKRDEEIVQRKKAEAALRESEENLRITLYSIGDAVITTDVNGLVQNMNPIAEELTGWSLRDAKNKPLTEVFVIVNAKTRKTVENPIEKALRNGKIVGLANHTVLISKTGQEYQISDSAAPVKDCNGEIKGVVLIFRDVTEEYEMQRLLRENEEKQRLFLENFLGIAYQLEYNTFKPLLFQGSVENITGYKAGDFIGGKVLWTEVVHTKDLKFVLSERYKLMNVDNYVARSEYRIINKNGETKWIYDIARCLKYEDGTGIIQGSIYDITDRKKTEEALKESEQRYRGLVENSPIGIISIDKKGRILHINPTLESILGNVVEKEEKFSNIFSEKSHFTKNFKLAVMESLESGKSLNLFDEVVNASGKRLTLKYYISPVFDTKDNVKMVIANIEDYTERKKAERELQRISKLESLGNLAGGIAHNFKNIMASMALNLEIMKMKPIYFEEGISKLKKSIEQASALATRFQTFTKSAEPVKEITDITKVILEADSMALSGSNLASETDFEEGLYNVYVDPKQMNEVFMNLIINAKQASPKGGKLHYSAKNIYLKEKEIGNLKEGNYVLIKVRDEGIGIPPENLNYIFDPFFTTKEDGNGLGLASVHFIIQKHEGHITVESEVNKGTTFNIYLPATKQIEVKKVVEESNYKLGGYKRILFMDDDDAIRDSISRIGEVLQYEFVCTANGEQALEEYKKALRENKPFDAVILDLTNTKGMGGEETIKNLRLIDPSVKAIVFSGYSDKPIMARYKEFGFTAKLEKPITVHRLSETLNLILNSNVN